MEDSSLGNPPRVVHHRVYFSMQRLGCERAWAFMSPVAMSQTKSRLSSATPTCFKVQGLGFRAVAALHRAKQHAAAFSAH